MREQTPPRRAWLRRHWLGSAVLLVALVLVGLTHCSPFPHPTGGIECPLPRQTVTWPSPPTQVVTDTPTSTPITVTLQVTQTLEVDLSGSAFWQLSSRSAYAPVLTLETPAGYLDASSTRCVWRFRAQQAGVVPLEFLGNEFCPSGSCTQAIFTLTVTVTTPQVSCQKDHTMRQTTRRSIHGFRITDSVKDYQTNRVLAQRLLSKAYPDGSLLLLVNLDIKLLIFEQFLC